MPFFFCWERLGCFVEPSWMFFSSQQSCQEAICSPILGVSLSGGIFFLLCATCRIQIFFLVAGVKARAFYMFLELNLSSQVFCDCCFKRLNIFFSFSGSRC